MIIKVAKIKNSDAPLQAFQMSKETIDELHYGDCKGIKDAIDMSEPGRYLLDNEEAGPASVTVHDGDIIRYEEHKSQNCPNGWNLWRYGLEVTVINPTKIVAKVEPREAVFFENVNEVTNFIKDNSSSDYFESKIKIEPTKVTVTTDWGVYSGNIGNCFIIKYGKDDFNVLTLGTPTVDEYYVLDAEGNVVKCLNEY